MTNGKAFDQIRTYKATIPGLFTYNAICIISDGMECRAGSVSAGFSRYMTWKSADGKKEASRFIPQLEILITGMLNPTTLLDLVRNFIIFEKSKKKDAKTGITQVETEKKLAAYHQYYAVNKAVENTLKAASTNGNRKGGVVWHTQGSGKSISMVFYTAKLVLSLNNPTVVVITDRNDLDDQLFDTFAAGKQLLRQEPIQAKDREHLKQLLNVASGGIVFTTIQKFLPEAGKAEYDRLSDRTNIVVIADEAHRTQYGFQAKLVDIKDKEITDKQRVRAKWTKLEAIVGNPERIKNLAKDIVTHFEQRNAVFEGKGLIVAMSRRIAVDLYNEIIHLKPEWHNDDLSNGAIKVVMTASSADGPVMQKHHTTKSQRRDLSVRMKDPEDPLRLVIVIDMWLTGFDVPCLHTLYVDKPMKDHGLMQAIARVNRVFKDKPGGLVVDYLGIATDLKKALSFYSNSGGKGDPAEGQEKAVAAMLEKLEVVRQLFFQESKSKEAIIIAEPTAYYGKYPGTGFNYRRFFSASPQEKLSIILQAEEHIMGLPDGKNRLIREVTLLSQAFVLSVPDEEAMAITDEVAFFQAVKARLVKFTGDGNGRSDVDIETTIKQIVDEALSSDQVVDIFDAAGIKKPEISILSEKFLLEIKGMKHQNLALELLKKILNDQIRIRSKTNLVKSKALLEMLENGIKRYNNGLLTTAEIIQFLVDEVAKKIKENDEREAHLGLSKEELAFYDALAENDSAVQVLGDDKLKIIAIEVAQKVKANATIDWTIRESARAKLMVMVKRTLNKYGYPPDMQQKAIDTVLKQAELLADYFVPVSY